MAQHDRASIADKGWRLPRDLRNVRDVRENLDERTRLWYHECRLSCKGFGSWGHAGKARPHVEQNPLTRFRLDLQALVNEPTPVTPVCQCLSGPL